MEDPLFRRLRLHAKRRLKFEPETKRARIFGAYKDLLRLENQMILRYHRKGDSGSRVAFARSCVIDVLIQHLFSHAIGTFRRENGKPPCSVAVVALGGYGRAELCPHSDVDIMFLYPDRVRKRKLAPLQRALTETMLYMLWDLKLKVGHSTRNLSHTLEDARKDIETKTGLLEARFLAGHKTLFQEFKRRYKKFSRKDNPKSYLKARIDDQTARRQKYEDTVFLQEPEIKEGVGGLREYHNVLWMAQIRLGIDTMEKLFHRKFLRKEEYRKLVNGYDFLLKVRHELHFRSERPTDLLNLEKQPQVAWGMGYRQRDIFKRVEAFMRDYYTHAKDIHQISNILGKKLTLTEDHAEPKRWKIRPSVFIRKNRIDGFIQQGESLTYQDREVFNADPERLIRVFRHSQQLHAEPDLKLSSLITESLPLLTRKVVNSPSANMSFRSILQTVGEVYPSLNKMHELGVLQRILPEFAGLNCLVQHEYYHRYTADIHTLNTILELDRIFTGQSDYFEAYSREIHETRYPSLLYTMLLLHDIGKGATIPGHAETGAGLADIALSRMQLAPNFKEQVVFIVRNHLEMARYWQRFDSEDPKTGKAFARIVGNEESLRYLYVLTFCDTRGTANSLWNGYKHMLHSQLFHNTLRQLGNRAARSKRRRQKQKVSKEQIKNKVPGLSTQEIEAHYKHLPESYFADKSVTEIAYHLHMVNRFLNHLNEADKWETLVPIVDWQDDLNLSMTVVNIVTWDRPGLFFKLAGAFSVAGVNILSSRALSRADNITLDTFYVCDPGGGAVREKSVRKIFLESLEIALLKEKDLLPRIHAQAKKLRRPNYLNRKKTLRAPIPPKVDLYFEPSFNQDIVEIQTADRIGILYRIAKAIYDHGFDIKFARILTESGIAVDSFHLDNIDKTKMDNKPDLAALEESLKAIVLESPK